MTTLGAIISNTELGTPPFATSGGATGKVVQQVSTTIQTLVFTAGLIPIDNTIPQISEGGQIITLAITPTSLSNKLVIEFMTSASVDAVAIITMALFRDAIAAALAAGTIVPLNSSVQTAGGLIHTMTVPSLSAQTYRIRMGANGGTTRVNGTSAEQKYGGRGSTTLVISEIAP